MAKQVNVCDSWNGAAQTNFDFKNSNTQAATVSAASGQTWPFVESSPITVPASDGSGPGKISCQLANLPDGTYFYLVDGCITGGQSKSVTIP